MESYKDLTVWKRAVELVREVYILTAKLPSSEVYGLSSQMRRAAVSIPSNIAEGHLRKGLKEFLQFLRIAYGSSAELETQLIITNDLYPKINVERAENLLTEVQKMLNALIKKLESK
ncbi:MAG: four helix bundle protein [bacterium]|nr:four helix bundle protein [bacterium]